MKRSMQFGKSLCVLVLAAVMLASASQALAVTYQWDVATGDSAITDGTGTWLSGAGNWYDGTLYDQVWANGNDAQFGTGASGSGGAVALSGTVQPNTITFNAASDASNYSVTGVAGTDYLTFANTTSTLTVAVPTSVTGTISADMATLATAPATFGTGNKIAKTGAGKLVLSGNNYLVGDVNATLEAGFTVEGGGELEVTGYVKASDTTAGSRGMFTNQVGATSAGNTLTISGSGKVLAGGLTIGGGTSGGNVVTISSATPGGSAASIANPSYHLVQNSG